MSFRTKYALAMGSALLALLPLAYCNATHQPIPDWLLYPCVVIMAVGSSAAYVIRITSR